jgi:hypothetical protein
MFENRQRLSLLHALFCLAAPFCLAHCGNANTDAEAHAGASNGGIANGGVANGGTANGGTANGGTANGGSPDASSEAGSSGAAGDADAGAAGNVGGGGGGGGGACVEDLLTFSSPNAQHVSVCSVITYPMNPPVYGDHYPVWAAYKSYSFPVPLGFLVHDLEHGAVELLYNCPEGCADEVALAQAFLDALPQDPRCTPEVKHQTVLSPDPTLPTRWAAIAWGHSLATNCFDSAAFQRFYDANIGHGPEDICADGVDLASDTCP